MKKIKLFDLLFAGNIGPATSVETIVECANLLKDKKDIMFHIVGDGLTKEKCENLAKSYGLSNIKFYGFFSVSEMKKFYKLADAFLLTMDDNVVVNNTLPAKLQSYMMAKKPIFASASGEAKRTIIESHCGLVCNSLDYSGLADLILNNYNDAKQLAKYGENGYNYYMKYFQKEKVINELIDILNNTIKGDIK